MTEEPIYTRQSGGAGESAAPGGLLRPGAQLGEFRLLGELGRGGMGVVWEAEQRSLGRRVALKVQPHAYQLDSHGLVRFQREAEAGGRLNHPGIVAVHAFGEFAGTHYIALELVEGGRSLADRLAELRKLPQLPAGHYRETAELFAQVAEAIEVAHAAGIQHRDVKPGNILIAPDGRPKVADFGLAHVEDALTLSRSGDFTGTPFYMSPEQAASKRIGIDHRTDVFSLGATLYEALTLTRAFDGDTSHQVLERVLMEEPRDPRRLRSRVPRELATICMKALEKKREHRYPAMAALAADLRRYLRHEPIVARPPGPATRVVKWSRRHPVISATALVAGVALMAISWLYSRALAAETAARGERDRANQAAERSRVEAERSAAAEREAVAERDAARWQGYVARIHAARAAVRAGEHAEAARRLAACPEEHRGWEWSHLGLLADPSLASIEFEGGSAHDVDYSPDGSRLAAACGDGSVRIWDADTRELLHELEAHRYTATAVQFGPGGRRLATGSWDETLRLWDSHSGEQLRAFSGQEGNVTCLSFSPDGARLAAGSWDASVRVWDVESGALVHTLRGHPGWIQDLSFSPDGRKLLSASNDHRGPFPTPNFGEESGSEEREAVPPLHGGEISLLMLWDAETGELLQAMPTRAVSVESVAYRPDGKRFASGNYDGTIVIWNASTHARVRTLEGHTGEVRSLAYTPDGERLVSGSGDRTTVVWDLSTHEPLMRLRGHPVGVNSVAVDPEGIRAVSAAGSPALKLWHVWSTAAVQDLKVPSMFGSRSSLAAATFDPRGETILSGGENGTFYLHDAATGEFRGRSGLDADDTQAVAFSPDGARFCTASDDGTLRVWDARTTEELQVLPGQTSRPVAVHFHPDGVRLVAADGDGSVVLWDLERGVRLGALSADDISLEGLAISPDGEHLVTGAIGGEVRVWNTRTLREVERLEGHAGRVPALAFSPDGSLLATGGEDRALRIWDFAAGRELTRIEGHEQDVRCAAFTPDGDRVVSGSAAGVLRLWHVDTGEELLVLRGHEEPVEAVAVSPDGARILSAAGDGRLLLWESDPAQAQAIWDAAAARERLAPLLNKLFREHLLVEDVLLELGRTGDLSPWLLERARALAHQRGNAPPNRLDTHASRLVRDPDRAPEDYARGVQLAELAVRAKPDYHPYWHTLGVALFRAGDPREARAALTRADELNQTAAVDGRPTMKELLELGRSLRESLSSGNPVAVSYTHLTLPTIYSV